jgi:hypothetical protein
MLFVSAFSATLPVKQRDQFLTIRYPFEFEVEAARWKNPFSPVTWRDSASESDWPLNEDLGGITTSFNQLDGKAPIAFPRPAIPSGGRWRRGDCKRGHRRDNQGSHEVLLWFHGLFTSPALS